MHELFCKIKYLPLLQEMVNRYTLEFMNPKQVPKTMQQLFLFMGQVIYKMYIIGGVVIRENLCLIIYWPIKDIPLLTSTTEAVQATAGIGELASIDTWVEKI
jgi:hypothetical protein